MIGEEQRHGDDWESAGWKEGIRKAQGGRKGSGRHSGMKVVRKKGTEAIRRVVRRIDPGRKLATRENVHAGARKRSVNST